VFVQYFSKWIKSGNGGVGPDDEEAVFGQEPIEQEEEQGHEQVVEDDDRPKILV
jgi:hypothetical protein